MAGLLETFREMDTPTKAMVIGGGVAIVLVLIWLFILLRRRAATTKPETPDLSIEIASLGMQGPPASGVQIECYNVAMRLAAVVLAPAGRMNQLPTRDKWPELLDQIVPGLSDVLAEHNPLIRAWPEQLSATGFAHLFFANAKLPGERGKGSPWCSLAGKFEAEGDFYMAALLFRSAKPNSLGEFTMEPTDWLGCVRVRAGE